MDGRNASAAVTIEVQNRPPQVSWEGPQKLRTGVKAAFVANGTDPDGNVTLYCWSFGDGGNATGASVEHGYRRAGRYLVTVKAVDDMGSNASSEAWVTVEETRTIAPSLPAWTNLLVPVIGLAVVGLLLLWRWKRRRDREYRDFFSDRR